jgi:RimJ/RimL family protein N-acetyltransferase
MYFNALVETILKDSSTLRLANTNDLSPEQLENLKSLLDDADNHSEFAGGNYVKGLDKDKQRVVALVGRTVVGFMTPRYQTESGYWRSGAIYVDPVHQGKGYASTMLSKFFSTPDHLPARVWIASNNTSSQKAFMKAGFIKSEQRNLSDNPYDQGYDWVKE